MKELKEMQQNESNRLESAQNEPVMRESINSHTQ
jgi:hypothetical protein